MKKTTTKLAIILTTALLFSTLGYSKNMPKEVDGYNKAPHIGIAIFHKINGHDAYRFVAQFEYSNAVKAEHGITQYMPINQVTRFKGGDQVTLSNEQEKPITNKNSKDANAHCQLTMHNDGETANISGRCDILITDKSGREIEHKGWIKPILLHTGSEWQLVYHDDKDGINIYAYENLSLN